MHRIQLRSPWSARFDSESRAIVYARKFHKPTGTSGQVVYLHIRTQPSNSSDGCSISIQLNGQPLHAEERSESNSQANFSEANFSQASFSQVGLLRVALTDLKPFNLLEIRIASTIGIDGVNGPILDTNAIPPFGSFVIESVELAID